MSSNIILRSMAKVAIKYENIVPHGEIFCTSILKVHNSFGEGAEGIEKTRDVSQKISHVFPKTWEIFQKNMGGFPKNVGDFLRRVVEIVA